MPAAAKLLGNHPVDRLGKLIGVGMMIEASRFAERPEFAIARRKQKRPQIIGVFEGCFDLFIRAHSDYIRNNDQARFILATSCGSLIRLSYRDSSDPAQYWSFGVGIL
jgi:hypothetical protein